MPTRLAPSNITVAPPSGAELGVDNEVEPEEPEELELDDVVVPEPGCVTGVVETGVGVKFLPARLREMPTRLPLNDPNIGPTLPLLETLELDVVVEVPDVVEVVPDVDVVAVGVVEAAGGLTC